MKTKTILKIASYYLLFIVGLFLILLGANWYLIKQKEARLGLAKPNFPYTKYTQEELDKMYPQVANENIPTRQTPEETYTKLITALKTGDLEMASQQFVAEKQKEWLESLGKIKERKLLEQMIKDLDKKLEKISIYDTIAQYEILVPKEDKFISHPINFDKDSNGDWKIKSL